MELPLKRDAVPKVLRAARHGMARREEIPTMIFLPSDSATSIHGSFLNPREKQVTPARITVIPRVSQNTLPTKNVEYLASGALAAIATT